MRLFKIAALAAASAAAFSLAACSGGQSSTGKQPQTFDSLVLFDPVNATNPIIPFPFDGLFSGFSAPTLNIPGLPAPLSDANLQDGFSTTASIFADIAGLLDYTTVPGHVILINSATGQALQEGVDFTVDNENATAADPLLKDPATGKPLMTPISSQRSRLLISPLKPLAPSTTYLAALISGMKTLEGGNVIASDEFKLVSSTTPVSQQPAAAQFTPTQQAELEGLRSQLILPIVQGLSQATHLSTDKFVLAWSFTTESIHDSLDVIAANAAPGLIAVAPTGLNTTATHGFGLADVYAGITTVPYYSQAPSEGNPIAPLSGFWKADPTKPNTAAKFLGQVPCGAFAVGAVVNGVTLKPSASTTACFPVPVQQSTQTIPIIVTVPNANSGQSKPASGWPVVIFQHGITQNRENIFAVADGLAQAGFVVIAADLPLHGITDRTDPFFHNQLFAGSPAAGLMVQTERTFDLDLENNNTSAPGPDGSIDPSGTYFINLQSLITSRDNNREASADLITLVKSAAGLDLNSDGTPDVDAGRIYFFGHSLGGIVGTAMLGEPTGVRAAVMADAGGGLAGLLDVSASFGPRISAGLAQGGLAEGTDDYETFLRFAQTVVDPGDPINYAVAARANHALYLIEVINDTVVPDAGPTTCPATLNPHNILSTAALLAACPRVFAPDGTTLLQDYTVETRYLSGTTPLFETMGLAVAGPLNTFPVTPPDIKLGPNLGYVVQFGQGAHGTVLSPAGPSGPTQFLAVTQEMQSEAAQFLASDGQCLAIGGSCMAAGAASNAR